MNPRFLAIGVAWVVAVAAVVAGWAIFVASGGLPEYKGGQPSFFTFAILSAPALGTFVLRRHPREWTGPLVCACVLVAMLAAIRTSELGVMSQVAGVIALVAVLLPAVIAMTHPALQTPRHMLRFIMWCWWLSAAGGLAIASVVFAAGSVPTAWWYTANPGPAGVVATTLMAVHAVIVMTAVAGTAAFAVSRYRATPVGGRAPLRPVVVPLIGWSAATAAAAGWTFVAGLGHPTAESSEPGNTIFVVLPAVLVYVFAVGIGWIEVMVRRPARSEFTAVKESGVHPSRPAEVERYLSRALADSSIRVLYPVIPADGGWVEDWINGSGEMVRSDVTSPERAVTLIRRGSTLIGMIEQDAAAAARPDAVELVATGAGLMMETERLMAAARRDLEQSRLLAARLLSASDDPRAELRAQLLTGPLDDLAFAAADLAAGTSITEIAPRLAAISAEVRAISHGVFPYSLTTGGLRVALPGVGAPDRRYPAPVEMTAYLIARFDRSAVIADTTLLDHEALRITTGVAPIPTVRDRVAALDGHLEQAGSRWTITLPTAG
jgi:hypothetical protein